MSDSHCPKTKDASSTGNGEIMCPVVSRKVKIQNGKCIHGGCSRKRK